MVEAGIDNRCTGSHTSTSPVNHESDSLVTSVDDTVHFVGFQESNGSNTFTDFLLTGAQAVEVSNWHLASNIIAGISELLLSQTEENLFSDMVFYFTQGLSYKCRDVPALALHEIVHAQNETMSHFQMLKELSPYVRFAQFTANQAILEATREENEVHILDLDIMDGIQWPPLMADLAQRNNVSLRITAIVGDPEKAALVQQTGRRLVEFAESVGQTFRFDQMTMEKEEDFDKIEGGHTLIANCMIHQLHLNDRNLLVVKNFLNGVSRLSPKLVVLVEEELLKFFHEAIQHYTALSHSLQYSYGRVGFELFQKDTMGLRIMDSVGSFPIGREEKMSWEESFSLLKNFKPIPMSATNVSQAKLLAGLLGKGYWVQNENSRLSLCWKSRPLTTASSWIPRHALGSGH
ncbi:nodulation-signaling pathway 2 protein [Populus alba x Populus x berolinensis]|uniref:Nodulation-signaling pathway 2 protein n=1 Tax=Populus alba x Populus x berolinensis TaxID=444605 RepID=A0AAD6QWX6_9ROSI|nr:nodulation-signaling pathway 2 protein [Populus alba x Populus x berolinensis]